MIGVDTMLHRGARSRTGWALLALVMWPFAARGQIISLSDIVGNGDGSGSADPDVVGIDPDTGAFQSAHFFGAVVNTGALLQPVAANPNIDSVFIISSRTIPINTDGVIFEFASGDVSGSTWSWILRDTTHGIDQGFADIWCGGIDSFAHGIGIHSPAGITFDLDALRAVHGAANVKHFSSFAGRTQCSPGTLSLHAILSDASAVLGSVSRIVAGANEGDVLELEIPDGARYLTLACGASNGEIGCDHAVFAEAVISAVPVEFGVRTVSPPAGTLGCLSGAAGPAQVSIRREGAGGQAVAVTERIFGAPGTAAVTAQNGGVVSSYIPPASDTETDSGFITAWLLLGPFSRPGGAAPGAAAMRLDYLTDGGAVHEANVQPRAGDTVQTDFNGAAASTGLPATTAAINPGGVPAWSQWVDTDDTVKFEDYYGGDVNDVMMYAVCYLRVASGVQVDFCVGSDDAVQVLLDGSEIHINDVARGAGPSEDCNDIVAGVILGAGIHRVVVKVFEGSNEHGFRLGVFHTGTRVPANGVSVCLDPLAQNPCPLDPAGVQVTWNTTRSQLASPGVGYSVDFGERSLRFRGTIEGRTTLGTTGLVASLPAIEYGPFADPAFDHAHSIGLPCPGTSVASPEPGTLEIAGAGTDIWVGGDQFVFAYRPVTGDFSARVTIMDRDFAPSSRWGKHGIMARQDCTTRSRYSFIHDQGEDLQDTTRMANRPTHGGADNFEITPAVLPPDNHPDRLRLDRCGNELIAFVLDETGSFGGDPGDWVEVGRHTWAVDPPSTVLVGLAVTSHAACQATTITFEDWDLFPACDAPVSDLACVANAGGGLDLTWVSPPGADPDVAIAIEVNGVQAETVPGTSMSASLPASAFPAGQISTIRVINSSSVAATCSYPPEVNPAGFIKSWLILGPLLRPGGAAPGEDQIHRDYLTDGATAEGNVEPAAGQPIEPDYGNLAASTGLAATPGRPDINPGGVPAWFEWNDPDDTIDYQNVFGTNIDNVMCYAATYVTVSEDTTVDLGLDSDDAVQVLVDGVEVHINNIARGMGGPNVVADTVTGVHLAPGRHLILVKVFEGTASHGFRLRFQDASLPPNPALPGKVCVDPDCSLPAGPPFLRGDVNNDGWVSMGDALYILNHRFLGGPGFTCQEAAETNSDGSLDGLSDAIYLLNFLFHQGPVPGSYPDCEIASSPLCVYPVSPCGALEVRNPEPTLRLEFEVDRLVEEGVAPNPVEAVVRLRNTEPGDFAVRGWSLSIRTTPHPGCAILDATTQGTLAEGATFEITREVDPEGSGVVSSIVLDLTTATTLPGNEIPHDLLRFSLGGTFVPGECSPCLLEFRDGLVPQGGGQPVRNLVDSGARDFQPFSRPAEVRFCSAATPLEPGGAPAVLSLPAAAPTALFRLAPRPAVGTVITLDLEGADPDDRTALYARWGGAPGPAEFDHAADERGRASQRLVIPFARDDACYVLVRGNVAAGGDIEATLRATASGIALERSSADCGAEGCDGMIHLAAQGAGFDAMTSFRLEQPPGLVLPALERTIVLAERAELEFDLSVTSPGVYDLVAQKGSGPTLQTARLAGALRVVRRRIGPRLEVSVSAPDHYREYQLRSFTLRYANTGDEEMRSPLFEVTASPPDTLLGVASDTGLRTWEQPYYYYLSAIPAGADVAAGPLQVLGIHGGGVPGRLPPGASGEIPILFRHPDPFSEPPGPDERLELFVRVIDTDPGTLLGGSSLGRPEGMAVAEWNGLRAALAAEHGADYREALSAAASRLARRGERGWRVRDLFRFAALAVTGQPVAAIVGTARGPDGEPLVSSRVAALRNGQVVRCAITDSEGGFALGNLADGTYRLAVEGHGIPLTEVTISGGEDVFPVVLQAVVDDSILGCPPAPPGAELYPAPPGLPQALLRPAAEAALKPAVSEDPNAKEGPDEDFPMPGQRIGYTIHFENSAAVEGAANRIVLIDRLSPLLDPATIDLGTLALGEEASLSPLAIGGTSLPSGYSWSTGSGRYDLEATLPLSVEYPSELGSISLQAAYRVKVVRTLDDLKEVTWDLCGDEVDPRTIDPGDCSIQPELAVVAGDLEASPPIAHIIWAIQGHHPLTGTADLGGFYLDDRVGLVPPNVSPPRGEGSVAYEVRVSESAMDEETIENNARIIFDTNPGDPTEPVTHKVKVPFRRGDVDDNGAVDLTDPINILNSLFVGADSPDCLDAADANDDGAVNVSDPISILNFLFSGPAPPPAAPGPYECGFDLTPDHIDLEGRNLGCAFSPARCE